MLKNWQAQKEKLGIAWIGDIEIAGEAIQKAKESADIVIVSFHQWILKPTLFQKEFVKRAVEAGARGARLVVGHRPHVVQPIEKYQKAWIAFSLGNFIFDQNFSKSAMVIYFIIKDREIKEVILRKV